MKDTITKPVSRRTNTRNHDDTWFMGLGGRLRFSHTGYITGEYTPRLHGYDPNAANGVSGSRSAPAATPCS